MRDCVLLKLQFALSFSFLSSLPVNPLSDFFLWPVETKSQIPKFDLVMYLAEIQRILVNQKKGVEWCQFHGGIVIEEKRVNMEEREKTR